MKKAILFTILIVTAGILGLIENNRDVVRNNESMEAVGLTAK